MTDDFFTLRTFPCRVSCWAVCCGFWPRVRFRRFPPPTSITRRSSGSWIGGKSTPAHEFNTHVFVTRSGADFTTRHVIEDAGNTLPWIARFGQSSRAGAFPTIATVHRHDGLPYSLTVRVPFLNGAPKLAADTKWEEGQVDLEVTGTRKVGEWDCWVVESSDGLGRRGTFLVDQETGIVTSSTQRIFMGQGDRFELSTRLVSTNAVPEAADARIGAIGESLRKLQTELGYAERATDFELIGRATRNGGRPDSGC